jgi:hypothetical protein
MSIAIEAIESLSKLEICVIATQQGKTFIAIAKMEHELSRDDEFGKSLIIINTMNTLANNNQLTNRLNTINETYGDGSVCVLSSKSKLNKNFTHVKNVLELLGLCFNEHTCPRVVVCCSNSKRSNDIITLIESLNNSNSTHISRILLFYDELHKYIGSCFPRSQLEQIHNYDIVKSITALTATPDRIFQKDGFWSKMRLINLTEYSEENYVGCSDMIFNCIDDFFESPYIRTGIYDELDRQNLGFSLHTLTRYPHILRSGARVFMPAHIRRIGHNKARDLIFEINNDSVVIIINGFEKSIQYKNELNNTLTILLISENEEICETISKQIIKNNLQNRPIVYTGLLCVGMGQTLTHKSLGSFTSAIFSHMDFTNDDIYQLFGRITGRMKDWDKYNQTEVFCPTIIMNRCKVMEQCAKNMAREHNGEIVSQEDYREPMNEMGDVGQSAIDNIRILKSEKIIISRAQDTDKEIRIFDSQNEAITFGITLSVKFNSRESHIAPKALQKNGVNPSSDELIKRMWGINKKTYARLVPTRDEKWCVYWRPSYVP